MSLDLDKIQRYISLAIDGLRTVSTITSTTADSLVDVNDYIKRLDKEISSNPEVKDVCVSNNGN